MIKIVVLSDSHSNKEGVEKITSKHKDADYFIHCGDGFKDLVEKSNLLDKKNKILCVRGNMDRPGKKTEIVEKINDHLFLICHGHQYAVHFDLFKLHLRAREVQADVVVFGHTHQKFYQNIDGIHFFNPGTIARFEKKKSFGIIKISEDGKIDFSFEDLN